MLRWSIAPAIVLSLVAVESATAQPVTATVVMKNGERHSGQNPWTRHDKGEFSLRKSLHDQLRVKPEQIAYVDFGGTADASPSLSGSQQAVVLRNGTVIKGQLIEMAHTSMEDQSTPYLVIIRDEQGQERRLPVNEVGRVYFSTTASTTGSTGSASQPPAGGGVVVPGNQRWVSTGITVRQGETLTFNTTGEIRISADQNDVATPAGSKGQRYAAGAPIPRALAGALIGRIGTNGTPFGIGDQRSVRMPEAGVLFLGINDDGVEDNGGEFRVEIQRTGMRRR
jgi:hypothetical protein